MSSPSSDMCLKKLSLISASMIYYLSIYEHYGRAVRVAGNLVALRYRWITVKLVVPLSRSPSNSSLLPVGCREGDIYKAPADPRSGSVINSDWLLTSLPALHVNRVNEMWMSNVEPLIFEPSFLMQEATMCIMGHGHKCAVGFVAVVRALQ